MSCKDLVEQVSEGFERVLKVDVYECVDITFIVTLLKVHGETHGQLVKEGLQSIGGWMVVCTAVSSFDCKYDVQFMYKCIVLYDQIASMAMWVTFGRVSNAIINDTLHIELTPYLCAEVGRIVYQVGTIDSNKESVISSSSRTVCSVILSTNRKYYLDPNRYAVQLSNRE